MSGGPIGIIASSGGSVVAAGVEILRAAGRTPRLHVVTDRPCGMEQQAERLGVPYTRIVEADRETFSARAARTLLVEAGCTWTTLFFARLVGAPLYDTRPCLNLHPSLLPAYPGFRAIERLHADGGRVLGATAHRVDASTDGGPIVAQVAWPVPSGASVATLQRWSFAQKLFLFLALVEADGRLPTLGPDARLRESAGDTAWSRPPTLADDLAAAYSERLLREGIARP